MRRFEKISFKQFALDIKDDKELYNEYKLPVRKTKGSAGYDFFSIEDFSIEPSEIKRIPTGIKSIFPNDEVLLLIEKLYTNVMEMAKKNNIRTICLPNINVASEFKEDVARVTINTLKKYVDDEEFDKIVFNTFTLDDYNIYSKYFE